MEDKKYNSWGRKNVDKYIFEHKQKDCIGYRVFIHKKNLQVNEGFETLDKAIKFRDECLKVLEENKLKKLKQQQVEVLDYPYNLINALKFNLDDVLEHFEERYEDVYNQGTISKEEKNVLDKRFKEMKTFREIGESLNTSGEWARLLIKKACFKLQCRKKYFLYGQYSYPEQKAKEQFNIYLEKNKDKWEYESAKKFVEEYEKNHPEIQILKMLVEELDISIRTFHCLKKSGINTIEQLCNLKESDLMKIKSLGKKGVKEIIKELKKLGMHLKIEEEEYEI